MANEPKRSWLSPRQRLALTVAVVVAALCTPCELWPLHGVLFTLTFIAHTLSGVPFAYLVKRFALFIPFVLLLSAGVPLSQGFAGGWELMATITLRSVVTFSAMLWLTRTLPFEELLATLAELRVPQVLLAALSFTYRYLFVLWDELERMRVARSARTFQAHPRGSSWMLSIRLLGMLLIRSLTRAERVHAAMCARGWDGVTRVPPSSEAAPAPRESAPRSERPSASAETAR